MSSYGCDRRVVRQPVPVRVKKAHLYYVCFFLPITPFTPRTLQKKKAHRMKTPQQIFDTLRGTLPRGARLSSGGLLDARGAGTSDVDVSVHDPDREEDEAYSIPGHDRAVNVKVSPRVEVLRAVRHRAIEIKLEQQYPQLAARARQLKADGMGTEKAWTTVLEMDGDPYDTMLRDDVMSTAAEVQKREPMEPHKVQELLQRIRGIADGEGSVPVAVAGAYLAEMGARPRGDYDLQVTPGTYKAILKAKIMQEVSTKAGYGPERRRLISGPAEDIELFDGTDGYPDKRFGIGNAATMDVGKPYDVWTPEVTLDWKRAVNRPKDQKDIKWLVNHIADKNVSSAAAAPAFDQMS